MNKCPNCKSDVSVAGDGEYKCPCGSSGYLEGGVMVQYVFISSGAKVTGKVYTKDKVVTETVSSGVPSDLAEKIKADVAKEMRNLKSTLADAARERQAAATGTNTTGKKVISTTGLTGGGDWNGSTLAITNGPYDKTDPTHRKIAQRMKLDPDKVKSRY